MLLTLHENQNRQTDDSGPPTDPMTTIPAETNTGAIKGRHQGECRVDKARPDSVTNSQVPLLGTPCSHTSTASSGSDVPRDAAAEQ